MTTPSYRLSNIISSLGKAIEAGQLIDYLGLNKSLEKSREILQPLKVTRETIFRHIQLEQISLFRSDTILNSVGWKRISNLYQKKEQNSSQTANNPQTVTIFKKGKVLRSNATLQNQVFFEIYRQVTANKNEPVKWSPSEWFGSGSGRRITNSQQSNYSNALQKLVIKGWVKQEKPARPFSSDTGNANTYVSLTPEGYAAIKQLQEKD